MNSSFLITEVPKEQLASPHVLGAMTDMVLS